MKFLILAALVGLGMCKSLEFNPLCEMMCIELYDPVCGSDGKTYGNSCFLSVQNCRAKVHQVHKGACGSVRPDTIAKRATIHCYECNSGVGIDNPNCPPNGPVHDGHTIHRECPSKCFVRDNEYYPGVVFRGCIADYPDLVNPIPEDGYHGYHHGLIYVCSKELCNGGTFDNSTSPPDNVGIP